MTFCLWKVKELLPKTSTLIFAVPQQVVENMADLCVSFLILINLLYFPCNQKKKMWLWTNQRLKALNGTAVISQPAAMQWKKIWIHSLILEVSNHGNSRSGFPECFLSILSHYVFSQSVYKIYKQCLNTYCIRFSSSQLSLCNTF